MKKLFVYGTLKQHQPNFPIIKSGVFCGIGQLEKANGFRMVSLGAFPALIPASPKDSQIINGEINQWDALDLLKKMGFKRHNCSLVPAYSLKESYKEWFRNELPTDGIVLKINDYKLQQTRPDYWQMAIKHYR